MTILEQISLAPLTTFKIGGQARYMAIAKSTAEIAAAFAFARGRGAKTFVLGGGSNVLIPDEGFDGVVIKMEVGGIERAGDTLIAGAGEPWDALVLRAIDEKLWGLENLSGIPGTVGGAVAGSIGAYGAALSQTLLWAEVFDARSKKTSRVGAPECQLGYRDSIFKRDDSLVILRAAFVLSAEPKPNLSYKDLAPLRGSLVTLEGVRDAVLAVRKAKFPDLAQEGTAGSYFKNPILSAGEAQALRARYPELPLFEMPETAGVKVPLAWLLDRVLRAKGMREGGARLFERQPLVVAAQFGTPARDVLALAQKIKTAARERLALELEEEVKIISR